MIRRKAVSVAIVSCATSRYFAGCNHDPPRDLKAETAPRSLRPQWLTRFHGCLLAGERVLGGSTAHGRGTSHGRRTAQCCSRLGAGARRFDGHRADTDCWSDDHSRDGPHRSLQPVFSREWAVRSGKTQAHLAEVMAGLQVAKRIDRLRPWVDAVDDRTEPVHFEGPTHGFERRT